MQLLIEQPGTQKHAAFAPTPDLRSEEMDAAKGILICLVALGHSALFTSAVPHSFSLLYSFHVFGFLFIPFLVPAKKLTFQRAADHAVRYLVPYVLFFGFTAALYFAMYRRGDGMARWGLDAISALLIGSALTLDRACGFQLFWFLPALWLLFLFRGILQRSPALLQNSLILALCLVHPLIGSMPEPVRHLVPFGLPIVAFIFPLGIITGWMWRRVAGMRPLAVRLWLGLIFLGSCAAIVWNGSGVNLAVLNLYTYRNPFLLGLHDLTAIAGFFTILSLTSLLVRIPGIVQIGRHSLFIYLAHSLVYQLILRVGARLDLTPVGPISRAFVGIALVFLASTLCLGAAELLARWPRLRSLVLPRSLEEWRGRRGACSETVAVA